MGCYLGGHYVNPIIAQPPFEFQYCLKLVQSIYKKFDNYITPLFSRIKIKKTGKLTSQLVLSTFFAEYDRDDDEEEKAVCKKLFDADADSDADDDYNANENSGIGESANS